MRTAAQLQRAGSDCNDVSCHGVSTARGSCHLAGTSALGAREYHIPPTKTLRCLRLPPAARAPAARRPGFGLNTGLDCTARWPGVKLGLEAGAQEGAEHGLEVGMRLCNLQVLPSRRGTARESSLSGVVSLPGCPAADVHANGLPMPGDGCTRQGSIVCAAGMQAEHYGDQQAHCCRGTLRQTERALLQGSAVVAAPTSAAVALAGNAGMALAGMPKASASAVAAW